MKTLRLKKGILLMALACMGFTEANAGPLVRIFKGDPNLGTASYTHVALLYEKLVCTRPTGPCGAWTGSTPKGESKLDLSRLFGSIDDNPYISALTGNVQSYIDEGIYSGRIVSGNGPIPRSGYAETLAGYTQNLLAAGERGDYQYIEDFTCPYHFAVWNFTYRNGEYNGYVILN